MRKQAPHTSKLMAYMLRLLTQQAKEMGGSLAGTYYIRPHQRYGYETGEVSPAFERVYEIAFETGLYDELVTAVRNADTPLLQELAQELGIKTEDEE